MNKRITPEVKAIADAHIRAKLAKSFDNPKVSSKEEALAAMREGKTFEEVLRQVETRFCSITTLVMSDVFEHLSQSYKSGVYKGFKAIFQQ